METHYRLGIRIRCVTLWLLGSLLLSTPAPAHAQDDAPAILIIYDTTGPFGHLGELYAQALRTLLSRLGKTRTSPIHDYRSGDLEQASAAVYIGTTYDEPIPTGFLLDVARGTRPVLWLGENLWQLTAAVPRFAKSVGFLPRGVVKDRYVDVVYKNRVLTRDPAAGTLTRLDIVNRTLVKVLAYVEGENGRQIPWAVQSRGLTYVTENPLTFVTRTDRYFAFCDMLFDALPSQRPVAARHRAIVRLEDVDPTSSPEALRAFADYFAARSIPFAVALIPFYVDPKGAHNAKRPLSIGLHDAPAVVAALRYMLERGGTLVLHGCTHQYEAEANPYSGASVDDAEFFRAHVDSADNVIWDGPVELDSQEWARARIERALAEIQAVGLPRPEIFEYPHYAGSLADSRAIAALIPRAFQRPTFYAGGLSGEQIDYSHSLSLLLPFVTRDASGWTLIPENLGNYVPKGYNNVPPTLPGDLATAAVAQSVVRDGIVGFFFHPTYDLRWLDETVRNIQAAGYEFVGVSSIED